MRPMNNSFLKSIRTQDIQKDLIIIHIINVIQVQKERLIHKTPSFPHPVCLITQKFIVNVILSNNFSLFISQFSPKQNLLNFMTFEIFNKDLINHVDEHIVC